MKYPKNVWNQVKNKTADEIKRTLEIDGWVKDVAIKTEEIYLKDKKRVSIHYHPQKTYGPKLLKKILDDIGWSIEDMRKLKFIK
jgi:predicted RNA binding protein YcfA (HicA-like mRNA interferase family)